ncbi:hypothetical protein AALC25_01105 [Lachnospiraceae bacterium 29-84]
MYVIKAGEAAKSANGTLLVDVGQVIRNLTGVEQDEAKKSLLWQVTEPKEVDDSEREAKKAMQIARRIARGEAVSPQDKAFLMRVNPQLAQMAELARQQGERIKHALQEASSKEEKQTIVLQAYEQVTEAAKMSQQFGELLGEAVKSAIQEAMGEPAKEEEPEEGQAISGHPAKAGNPKEGQAISGHPAKQSPSGSQELGKLPQEEGEELGELLQEESQEAAGTKNHLDQAGNVEDRTDTEEQRELAGQRQEEIMGQFFPEEWASMLDCKG